MANQPKRRFVELKVNEVSLVDTPANEQRFIVVKRLQPQEEEHIMSDVTKTEGATNEAPKTEEVKVDVAKAAEAAGEVMGVINELVSKAKDAAADVDVEKAGGMAAFKAQMLKAGMSSDMAMKAMAAAKALGMFVPAGSTPIAKSASTEEMQQAAVDGVLAQISKAKAFTPGRQEALKAAFSTLKGLLEDLESLPDGGVKGLPTDDNMHIPNLPKGKSPPSEIGNATQGTAMTGVHKALEDIAAKMGDVVSTVKSLDGRVADIEKTRAPSKGANATEVTETKTNKSLWNGVL